MAGRPRVLPEPFSGVGSWDQWESHLEDVAALNESDNAEKLLWLKVRLTGRARTAFSAFARGDEGDIRRREVGAAWEI